MNSSGNTTARAQRQVTISASDYIDLVNEFYVVQHLVGGAIQLAVSELEYQAREQVEVLGAVANERLAGLYTRFDALHQPTDPRGGEA